MIFNNKNIVAVVYNILILSCLVYVVFLALMPRAFWFDYEKIEPINTETNVQGDDVVFNIDQSPKFISFNVTRRTVRYKWSDALKCDFEDDDIGFIGYHTIEESQSATPSDNRKNGGVPWKWSYVAPNKEGVCFLKSTTCVALPFGFDKCKIIESNQFEFRNIESE